ncbi:VWA domain-containing protein [Desulfovibrio subterraneus]|uniref:cobaltochelatase CobT-related protein n=1 Tax=Desulfovibrio subterraneus TaxID=2718620 RepID=UPI0022B9371B|nr:VWA domain-containing protein [Desulfovibrio subterraneus]WBF66030.1 VWA domain-containing protein [Desulfovibrio subterraneus]
MTMPVNPILQSLPLLASVLGRRYGVTVRIGGTEAYTDGTVIQLPALPAQHDETFAGLVRGYADHEAAHIRHTDFSVCKLARSPLEKHIWNTFEDWRVENAMAAIYPGCRGNFRWLIRHCFLQQKPIVSKEKAILILDWLLLTVRSWDEPALAVQCEALAHALDARWPWLRLHLEAVLHTMRGHCPDSAACLDYARQVIDVLQTATRETGLNTEKSGIIRGKIHDRSVANEASSRIPLQNGAKPTNDLVMQPSSSQEPDAQSLQELLAISADALPVDLGQRVGQTLSARVHVEPANALLSVAREGHKYLSGLSPDQLRDTKLATNGMAARFHGLLQAAHLTRCGSGRRGRVDTRSLHKIATHDPKVFLRNIQRPGINTAVHILLDCSGSMRKRMTLACQATYAVARALERTGINIGVTAFPAEFCPNAGWTTLKPIVRHGHKLHADFGLAAGGQTPLGPALWWVMQEMQPLQEHRKIVLIMTDGEPDCTVTASEAIQATERIGMELYGVGIMSSAIQQLLPGTSTTIWELSELAPAMFSLLRKALIPTT